MLTIKEIIANHGFKNALNMAEATGIPYKTLYNWASGTREPSDWMPGVIDDSLLLHELLDGKKTLADVHRAVADRES